MREKKFEEILKQASAKKEENLLTYPNTMVSNPQNKQFQVNLQPIPVEEPKQKKQTPTEENSEDESAETEYENKQVNLTPWIPVVLKIANDLGIFSTIGTLIGESIIKPAEPIKVELREIKKEDKKEEE